MTKKIYRCHFHRGDLPSITKDVEAYGFCEAARLFSDIIDIEDGKKIVITDVELNKTKRYQINVYKHYHVIPK